MRLPAILTLTLFAITGPLHASPSWREQPVDILPETIESQAVTSGSFDDGLAPWIPTTCGAPNPDASTTWSVLDHADDPLSEKGDGGNFYGGSHAPLTRCWRGVHG